VRQGDFLTAALRAFDFRFHDFIFPEKPAAPLVLIQSALMFHRRFFRFLGFLFCQFDFPFHLLDVITQGEYRRRAPALQSVVA